MTYFKAQPTEPLILEPQDHTELEWDIILKLFGMKEADRIVIKDYTFEAFGVKNEHVDEPVSDQKEKTSTSNNEVKIENMHRVCTLIDSLVTSGYDLHVTPVYREISEEEKKRAELHNYRPIPRLEYCSVEIGEKHGIDDCLCCDDEEF